MLKMVFDPTIDSKIKATLNYQRKVHILIKKASQAFLKNFSRAKIDEFKKKSNSSQFNQADDGISDGRFTMLPVRLGKFLRNRFGKTRLRRHIGQHIYG